MLVIVNGSDVYAFSIVLSIHLLGLVSGTTLAACIPRSWRDVAIVVALCLLGPAVFVSILLLGQVATFRTWLGDGIPFPVVRALTGLLLMWPGTLLLGLLFPLLVERIAEHDSEAGAVSTGYLWNTAGAVFGALTAGFLMIPNIGLQNSMLLVCTLAMLMALFLVRTFRMWMAGGVVAAGLVLLLVTPPGYLRSLMLPEHQALLFAADDEYGVVTLVQEWDSLDHKPVLNLVIDGFNMAGDNSAARRYAGLLGILPGLLHSAPESALVICLGMGNSVEGALSTPGIQQVTCVELSSTVAAAFRHIPHRGALLDDPRLRLHIGDGRNFLLTTDQRFDVITAEPPPPSHSGVVNLYTTEYYELCRARLRPGGLVAQWLPVNQMTKAEAQSLIRSFQAVFLYTWAFDGPYTHVVLIGSVEPRQWTRATLRPRFEQARHFLQPRGWSLDDVVAACLKDPAQLREYVKDAPAVTDDRPLIEFSRGPWEPNTAWWLSGRGTLVEPHAPTPAEEANQAVRVYTWAGASDPITDYLYRRRLLRYILERASDNPYYVTLLGCHTAGLKSFTRPADIALRTGDTEILEKESDRRLVTSLRALFLIEQGRTDEARRLIQPILGELQPSAREVLEKALANQPPL